ncbi:hypothetical protein [Natrinema gelatinilyticum]|uniref:hypothetical protein n=1 Tax=Natrinema gelatinilyticum TaxID=2961571 RepID=UPI0020C2F1D5|nr:hypothetical protein [Natrinema gelatinilyticum]
MDRFTDERAFAESSTSVDDYQFGGVVPEPRFQQVAVDKTRSDHINRSASTAMLSIIQITIVLILFLLFSHFVGRFSTDTESILPTVTSAIERVQIRGFQTADPLLIGIGTVNMMPPSEVELPASFACRGPTHFVRRTRDNPVISFDEISEEFDMEEEELLDHHIQSEIIDTKSIGDHWHFW